MKTADRALNNVNSSIAKVNRHLEPVSAQLVQTLSAIQNAGYHVGVLAEYLGRHPESLITGKHR